jgi:hypothetical protein
MTGSVKYSVCSTPSCATADVRLQLSATDIRCRAGVSTCGAANAAAGSDYTGELQVRTPLRITDKYNGASQTETGTVSDTSVRATAPCVPTTSDTTIGAACSLTTTFNTILPGSVVGGLRAVWELGDLEVLDGGIDGSAGTSADNSLFLKPGIFAP